MNADGEVIQTGLGQSSDELDHYSITVWAYLKDSRQTYTIMNELLKVEEGGYIASNIGDWVHPYQTSIPMKVGVWQQITLVKDGSDVTIYIDGESGGREEREPQENPYTYIIGSALPGRELLLHDNQTLVISPGAVLYGTVAVRGIVGNRGVADGQVVASARNGHAVIVAADKAAVHRYVGGAEDVAAVRRAP